MTWFLPVFITASVVVLIVGLTLFDEAEHPHDRGQFGRWS